MTSRRVAGILVWLVAFGANGADLAVPEEVDFSVAAGSTWSRPEADLAAKIPADGVEGAPAVGRAFARLRPERKTSLRGSKEAGIYARNADAVVLVVTRSGIGSGVVLSPDGRVVTNWHVVQGADAVGVIFRPVTEGAEITKADVVRAKVVKRDEVADLALLELIPRRSGLKTIPLGTMTEAQIGADVHAIGHPTGETWTYTKGLVSQVRKSYQWTGDRAEHKADVIQTQTPINPGNSGGPLLSDEGRLVGINSFKASGSEGLNFAVTVDEVRRFLDQKGNREAPKKATSEADCELRVGERRHKAKVGYLTPIDTDCDNKPDAVLVEPDDPKKPVLMVVDDNGDGKADSWIFDEDRDGRWDYSYFDTDADGRVDHTGINENGDIMPARIEPCGKRCPKVRR